MSATDPVRCGWDRADLVRRPRSAPQGSESLTEAVRETVTRVLDILEDPVLKDPAKLMPRRRMLEEVIAGRFDYAEISKRALAADWTPLNQVQRAEFVELFQRFLSDRYAEKIERYGGEQVVYLAKTSTSHTQLSGPASCSRFLSRLG